MLIDHYCTSLADNRFSFTRQQASQFAKRIANDFNPLHDEDSTRFCVPGDLLFAKILFSEGLYADMRVTFNGMVSDGIELKIATNEKGHQGIYDAAGKTYLDIEHHGTCSHDQTMLEQLVRSYVAFSGDSFPSVVVPLMKAKNVMFNPVKPLVIYDSMSLKMTRVDLKNPYLEVVESTLQTNGKRGKVSLNFLYRENGAVVGKGTKTMILSGLRPFDQQAINAMVEEYIDRKHQFSA